MVASAIARTLGLADDAVRTAVDAVVDRIGDGHVLLVLDNFEQVVGAGPTIADLLRRCPNLSALVTTRVALRVSGEQEYPVPGLPAPPDTRHLSEMERLNLPRALREYDLETLTTYEAVRLFIARASSVKPGFAVTNANAPAVAAISSTLHGMPLAIELAAARIKLLTPDQILARLEHHLDLLTAGSRDLPERQQTLRGAIAWSYDLLDDGARRLVDRLSVFRGGFELETAERRLRAGVARSAATSSTGSANSWTRASSASTRRPHEQRFSMLETIREYAAEMLDARGETTATQRRLADAMIGLAELASPQLSGADQRAWLDRLEREHDNLRAVARLGDRRTRARGRGTAGVPALALLAAARLPQRGARPLRCDGGEGLDARADHPRPIRRSLRRHRVLAVRPTHVGQVVRHRAGRLAGDRRQGGDRQRPLRPLVCGPQRADERRSLGRRTSRAASGCSTRRSCSIGRPATRPARATSCGGSGSYHYFGGDPAAAEPLYRESLELHRRSGQRTMEAWSLHMLSLSAVGQRHFDDARESGRHALRHFYEAGDVAGVTLVLDDLAIIAVADGDPAKGGRLWGAARHLQQTTGTLLADFVDKNMDLFGVARPRDALSPAEPSAARGRGRRDEPRRGRHLCPGRGRPGPDVRTRRRVHDPAHRTRSRETDASDRPPIALAPEADPDPGLVILTCANCGAAMDERKCKLICRCGYFLSCSDYY